MKILYLTLSKIDLSAANLYSDLINALTERGHEVTLMQVCEPKNCSQSELITERGVRILRVLVGELFGVNFIKKGINTLRIEPKLKGAMKKFLSGEQFDLVLYATPPITFAGAVKYAKGHFGCKAFLMLKDIFPQNAVDIGLFPKKSPIYTFFRAKEKALYRMSDVIGCMSEANKTYLLRHNPDLSSDKITIFPNTQKVEPPLEYRPSEGDVRFVFGGNFGKPQAIDFLLSAITSEEMHSLPAKFVFIGNGSEKDKVMAAAKQADNMEFYDFMPPGEYDKLMAGCDVGLISLDYRFTIPNYPSRTLGYMAAGKPMLAATDTVTDIKDLMITQAHCGLWCPSNDEKAFIDCVRQYCEHRELLKEYGENGRAYFETHFNVERSVSAIEEAI